MPNGGNRSAFFRIWPPSTPESLPVRFERDSYLDMSDMPSIDWLATTFFLTLAPNQNHMASSTKIVVGSCEQTSRGRLSLLENEMGEFAQ